MLSFIAISAMFRGEVHYGDSSSGLIVTSSLTAAASGGGAKTRIRPPNLIDRKISILRPIATEYEIFGSDIGQA